MLKKPYKLILLVDILNYSLTKTVTKISLQHTRTVAPNQGPHVIRTNVTILTYIQRSIRASLRSL